MMLSWLPSLSVAVATRTQVMTYLVFFPQTDKYYHEIMKDLLSNLNHSHWRNREARCNRKDILPPVLSSEKERGGRRVGERKRGTDKEKRERKRERERESEREREREREKAEERNNNCTKTTCSCTLLSMISVQLELCSGLLF